MAFGQERGRVAGMGDPGQDSPGAWGGRAACRAFGDQSVGAEMDWLVAALEDAVEAGGQVLELHAGPIRVRVAADHAHQAGAIGARGAQTDAGDDILAGAGGEAVEISGDRQDRLAHIASPAGNGLTSSSAAWRSRRPRRRRGVPRWHRCRRASRYRVGRCRCGRRACRPRCRPSGRSPGRARRRFP